MVNNVNKATPVYATSETVVWWDMDTCPLPNGYDPSRLSPRIDTELKNLGYGGPLSFIAVGNLNGIPFDFLKVLSSNGFVIKHSGYGMCPDMSEYFVSRDRLYEPPPVTIMIISADQLLLEEVPLHICVRPDYGYNLLLAYPPFNEPKQPHPSSFVRFGGEWFWDRASLLKGGSSSETRRHEKGSEIPFSCEFCCFFSPSFDDLISHLQSVKHTRKVEMHNEDREDKLKRSLEELEADKRSEHYLELLRPRQSFYDSMPKYGIKKFSKQSKGKKLEIEKEFNLPSKAKMLAFEKAISFISKNSTAKKGKAKNWRRKRNSILPFQ